jgi:hypothetical protein
MGIDFNDIKDKAVDALEAAEYKEELKSLLDEYKELFKDETVGYFKGLIRTFTGKDNDFDPEAYAEFIAALDDAQLVVEAAATADEIEGLVVRYNKKKQFVEDLKSTTSLIVRKAIMAALVAYLGPVGGQIAGFLKL